MSTRVIDNGENNTSEQRCIIIADSATIAVFAFFSSIHLEVTMAKYVGGLKGFIQRTGKAFYAAGIIVRDYGTIAARLSYRFGGNIAFAAATTSMIVLLPLMFETTREVQVRT